MPHGTGLGGRVVRVLPPVETQEPYIADMVDILLGLLAIFAGAAMLLAGQFVLRLVLPIWGFFVGFAFGAGLVSNLADERFLGTVLGWVLGLVFALIFALFAYLYFYVAVVIAMAAFGFAIGSGLVVALGIDWSWVAVLVGLLIGAVMPDANLSSVLAGGALAGGILLVRSLLTGGVGMGMGDVKLATFVGLALGFELAVRAMLLMAFAGGIAAVFLLLTGLRKRGEPIPYAPFISAGALAVLLWQGAAFVALT